MSSYFARILTACAAILTVAISPAEATIDASLQMQLGNPSGASADPANHQHYLIQRTVEAIDYNDTLGLPNWASWDLTASDLGSSGRSPTFLSDTSLPSGFYEVTNTDYSGSGYDRGHMCPSADRTDNDSDNELVFLMSNIIPQTAANNSGVWGSFEGYCRTLAQSGNELLIICGPGGFDGSLIQPSLRVFIPAFTWKVVVVVPSGAGTAVSRITTATRVIAIKIPNTDSVSGSWQNFVTSARQIEADTGFTFFTALPPAVADVLRDKVDGVSGSLPAITSFSPGSGSVGASVVITGSNFGSASEVTFHGVSASYHVDSATQITATVPVNATPGPVSVTKSTGTAISSSNFTVTGSSADLTVSVTHFGNFSQRDTGDTYTIVVTNVGTISSTGTVSVAEAIPTGLTATAMSGVGWAVNMGTMTCTRSNSLLAGASYPPITVIVNVASNAPASVTNTVVISGGADGNAANNTAQNPTTINPSLSGGGPVQTLFGWDTSSLPGGTGDYGPTPYPATFTVANLSASGLTRGTGLTTTSSGASGGWGASGFTATTEALAISGNQTITFGATAAAGYTVSYSAISRFDYRHSPTGPSTGVLQYQIGSGSFNDITALSYPSTSSTGASLSPINLTGVSDLQNVAPGVQVTFRIVNYGGGASGTWYVYDTANSSALDLEIQGTISPAVTAASDLVVSVSHLGNFRQGDNGDTYTIGVTNIGGGSSAGTVTVVDTLPPGLTATSIGGPGWIANLATLTCTRAETLTPGAGYPPITLVVSVATNAGAVLTNTVAVSGGSDTNAANNIALNSTTIIPLTPLEFWRLQWFGIPDNSGVAANDALSSNDGMPNLLKYALGLDPFVPAANPVTGDASGGFLRLMSPKNPVATDVSFFAETADTLTSPWSTNGVTIDLNSASEFQAHRTLPINSSSEGFLRLKVVQQ